MSPILLKMNRYDLILSVDTFSTIFDQIETNLKQINGLFRSAQNLVNTKKSPWFSKMVKTLEKNGISCPISKQCKTLTRKDMALIFFPVKAEVSYFMIPRRYLTQNAIEALFLSK